MLMCSIAWRRLRPPGWLLRAARVLVLVPLLGALVLSALQTTLLFPGQATQGRPEADPGPIPDAERLELTSRSGATVGALFGPALTPDGRPHPEADRRPTILYFYGNGQCLAFCRQEFDMFRRLGANVMLVDYLGYGLSGGEPGEAGCYEAADAALEHLRNRPDIDPDRIVAAGWSLGGAVAIDLARREPLAGLVVFCSFTSLSDMVRHTLPIPGLTLLLKHRFESLDTIRDVTCPILIGHGTQDRIIPVEMADHLAEAAGGPVRRFRVPSDHNNFYLVSEATILQELGAFLERIAADPTARNASENRNVPE